MMIHVNAGSNFALKIAAKPHAYYWQPTGAAAERYTCGWREGGRQRLEAIDRVVGLNLRDGSTDPHRNVCSDQMHEAETHDALVTMHNDLTTPCNQPQNGKKVKVVYSCK